MRMRQGHPAANYAATFILRRRGRCPHRPMQVLPKRPIPYILPQAVPIPSVGRASLSPPFSALSCRTGILNDLRGARKRPRLPLKVE